MYVKSLLQTNMQFNGKKSTVTRIFKGHGSIKTFTNISIRGENLHALDETVDVTK